MCSWIRHMLILLFLSISLGTHLCLGAGRLSVNESLFGYQTLVSDGGNFVLGFFKPGNSSKAYIGVLYNKVSTQTAVWVANRETPVSDPTSSMLRIYGGNLVLFNESSYPIWSTNLNSTNSSSVEAVLGDDGNLMLIDASKSSEPLWQSFDHPADTWLPGAKLGLDKKTGKSTILTSWKSRSDPAPGLFSLQIDPDGTSQYFISWNSTKRYWKSGLWNGQSMTFQNVPEMRLNYIYNYSYVDNENGSYFTYSLYNDTIISRLTMTSEGQIQMTSYLKSSLQMLIFWAQPRQNCDVYALCGPFGTCSPNSLPFCQCLKGFDPKEQSDWDTAVFWGGCSRRSSLQCENPGLASGKISDRFFRNENMRLPDNNQTTTSASRHECESTCLRNCACTAYAYDNNKCLIWHGDILDLQQLSAGDVDAKTLYLRLSASEFSGSKSKGILIGGVIGTVVVAVLCLLLLRLVVHKRNAANKRGEHVQDSLMAFGFEDVHDGTETLSKKFKVLDMDMSVLHDTEKRIKDLIESGDFNEEDKRYIDAHAFDFDSIAAATDYFSDANKLGRGGFGPVYKGRFPGGQEIAVKRLSSVSGQGLEEFKNEVLLIAKLQHRNLVRLLGYCVKGDEKILVYEFMPNKSLDFIIFNKTADVMLNWEARFNIILGVARGLLYLHQDSRLTIVHRDLKTSNILLDKEMNPKIADFGLAKIVEGKKVEGNTSRVAGTYGYMSPEYALDGLFSAKSDVFSFGVVVLEILSGKRNTAYFNSDYDLSLLRYAWKLWRQDKALAIMDETLSESCNAVEFLKCVNVALLCIQEDPADRPTMGNVIFMLSSENDTFPKPRQPAMFAGGGFNSSSINNVVLFSSRREQERQTR